MPPFILLDEVSSKVLSYVAVSLVSVVLGTGLVDKDPVADYTLMPGSVFRVFEYDLHEHRPRGHEHAGRTCPQDRVITLLQNRRNEWHDYGADCTLDAVVERGKLRKATKEDQEAYHGMLEKAGLTVCSQRLTKIY